MKKKKLEKKKMEELKDLLKSNQNPDASFSPSTLNRILILLHKELLNHDEKLNEIIENQNNAPKITAAIPTSSFLGSSEERSAFEDKMLGWLQPVEKDVSDLKRDLSNFTRDTKEDLEKRTNLLRDDTGQKMSNLRTDLILAQKNIRQLQNDFSKVSSNAEQLSVVTESLKEMIDHRVKNATIDYEIKLEKLEEAKNKEIEELRNENKKLKQDIDNKTKENQENIEKLHQTLVALKKKANALPETFQENPFDIVEVDGRVDISPLIRGVYRDSRRIDGFNEIIAGIRLQSEDCVKGINSTQEQTRTLIHHCHDISRTEEKIVEVYDHKTNYLQKSIKNIEQHILTIIQYLYKLNDSINHTNSNCTKAFDTLVTILTQITTRPFPLFGDFSDLIMENVHFKEMLDHDKGVFEVDREKYQKIPKFTIEIPDFSTTEAEAVKMQLDEIKTDDDKPPTADENVLQESVEEIRMNMNTLRNQFDKMKECFVYLNKDVSQKLESKADEETTQRIYEKMTSLLHSMPYSERNEHLAQILTSRDQRKVENTTHQTHDHQITHKQVHHNPQPPILNLQAVVVGTSPKTPKHNQTSNYAKTKAKSKQIIQRPTSTAASRLVSMNVKSTLD